MRSNGRASKRRGGKYEGLTTKNTKRHERGKIRGILFLFFLVRVLSCFSWLIFPVPFTDFRQDEQDLQDGRKESLSCPRWGIPRRGSSRPFQSPAFSAPYPVNPVHPVQKSRLPASFEHSIPPRKDIPGNPRERMLVRRKREA